MEVRVACFPENCHFRFHQPLCHIAVKGGVTLIVHLSYIEGGFGNGYDTICFSMLVHPLTVPWV